MRGIDPVREAENLAADFDEAFNTLFDELDKLPKEHRTKAFDMLSKTPWFNGKPATDMGEAKEGFRRI
jgi:hypothetical protein